MSILPITKQTIVYGSNDYGQTIHAESEQLNRKMRLAAKKLNIKSHYCGMTPSGSNRLWSPADLEGHAVDDRFYLLDFSRVMPPEYPKPGVKMAHLFRLLRPEFVRKYPVPLCSDAFSGFIRVHNPEQHNLELQKATHYLTQVLVPAFAPQLQRLMVADYSKAHFEQFNLTEALHSRGINIRYLGILRHHMTDKDCKTLIFVEMCARVVKNNLRLRLRERMRKLGMPLDEPYRRIIIDFLNLLLGHNDQSEEYWAKNLKTSLIRKFELSLTEEEARPNFPLKCILDYFSDNSMDGKLLLFNRIQKICGLKFSQRINEEFSTHINFWVSRGEQPLDDTDLDELGVRVKHMNIITYAQAYSLHLKGNMAWGTNPLTAQRFYKMAMEKFAEALSTDPTNSDMLCHCAEIAMRNLEGVEQNLADFSFSLDDPHAQEANNYFLRATAATPNDSYVLFQYAQFLDKCGQIQKAEDFYLRSLEINPNNVACLQEYGNFLTIRKGHHDEAEQFFLRSSKCTELIQQALRDEASEAGTSQRPLSHVRHRSKKDLQNLSQLAGHSFRERARNEINLCSSPTLRETSDEVMVQPKKDRAKSRAAKSGGDVEPGTSSRRVNVVLFPVNAAPLPAGSAATSDPMTQITQPPTASKQDLNGNDRAINASIAYEDEEAEQTSDMSGYENDDELSDAEADNDDDDDVDDDDDQGSNHHP
eukprot:TRINITY_DN3487_c0_g1_i6.p1 TRINITY_DN3487_c0_g1~~TRINITY_DN3487_c0_g1_i6.p1  ORF type:complete len:703 (-),score=108.99 TRINITY_DN3487_c0_g1_i6:22-2130(-)